MQPKFRESYSQAGEDMIIDYIFKAKGIAQPSYMDIGANDPFAISNTAFFYKKGCRGINIEPNPVLFKKIQDNRPGDINLNVGIGSDKGELDFYILDADTMSTFSKSNAEELCDKYSFSIKDVLKIQVESINAISDDYFGGKFPDFISLDTEGLDLQILTSMDLKREGAYVICAETIEYAENFEGKKETELINYLVQNDYIVYADTYINTVFVKRDWLLGRNY